MVYKIIVRKPPYVCYGSYKSIILPLALICHCSPAPPCDRADTIATILILTKTASMTTHSKIGSHSLDKFNLF